MNPKIIAFYLPQFYPFKENNEWWGKGFTEWTNVGKAKPLWKGHYQPRVPADLGYYDLRVPEVREQQAELAREAGVTAFCYWHYWFGNGKRLLERVFDEVLESGKPDFPFCLGWANHTWYAKTWNKDFKENKLLIKQTYPGEADARAHFDYLLKAFKDPRYLKIDNMPFLFIFEANNVPSQYVLWFKKWAIEEGFSGLFICGNGHEEREMSYYREKGFDAITYDRVYDLKMHEYKKINFINRVFSQAIRFTREKLMGIPRNALDYRKHMNYLIDEVEKDEFIIPEIVPQWDHSPRSGKKSKTILYNSSPDCFFQHVMEALNLLKDKKKERQILILKSWNEWAEGNYMEPDLVFGKGYIHALKKALSYAEQM